MGGRIDPITFEVITNALCAAADEMALVVMRSAYSPVVRDSMDYSTALCDRNGQVVAQGLTLALQLGAFPDAMRQLILEFRSDMHPGDVFIFNDPYGSGGQHLPDIYIIKPIFLDDELEGYAATIAHQCDIGGIAPGSTAMHATEVFQEGLRLPIVKLFEAGKPNRTVFRIIEKNTRLPIQVLGDLRAQLAACNTGERELLQLLRRYGAAEVRLYIEELHARAERMMRAAITALPDGSYSFVDYIDGFGDSPEPLPIRATVVISGSEITVDLAGSAAQVPAAINCPMPFVNAAAYCAIRCVTNPDIPNCEGFMRPIRVVAPEGTIVNPILPGACAARGVIGYRTFDAIMGALAQAVPERVMAGSDGGASLFVVGGYHQGRPFVITEIMVGTWGARAMRDGAEGVSSPSANLSNQPIELIEAAYPLEVVEYSFVQDSGGAGKFRGGLASSREWRLRTKEAQFTIRTDRRDHPPYGIAGGDAGSPSENIFKTKEGVRALPTMPMEAITMREGDSFHHIAAGGGGFGDPRERDPEMVYNDILDGKVSLKAARERYAVVVDSASMTINHAETAKLRPIGGVKSTVD